MKLSPLLLGLTLLIHASCSSWPQPTKSKLSSPAELEKQIADLRRTNDSLQTTLSAFSPEVLSATGLYRIKKGDTGARIARDHQLPFAALITLNPSVNWSKLQVGQVVRVCAPDKTLPAIDLIGLTFPVGTPKAIVESILETEGYDLNFCGELTEEDSPYALGYAFTFRIALDPGPKKTATEVTAHFNVLYSPTDQVEEMSLRLDLSPRDQWLIHNNTLTLRSAEFADQKLHLIQAIEALRQELTQRRAKNKL